jgi:septal ring factor EnvC (AmiA/AmiB activator)
MFLWPITGGGSAVTMVPCLHNRSLTAVLILPLGLGGAALQTALAFAQDAPAGKDRPALRGGVTEDALKQREQEFEALQAERKKAAEAEAKLREEIDAIAGDRRKLNQQLIETAARVRTVEQRIGATEERLKPLDKSESAIRASLEERRAVIAEVLAALQRMGRRPPPAVLVQPEDALQSVRSAIMLGAVLPEMRQQAEQLVSDLAELVRLRKEIAGERETLARDLAMMADDQQRLSLLVEGRQKRQTAAEGELEAERQRATALARQADNVKDLIAKLEQGLDGETRAARAAARAALEGRPAPGDQADPAVRLGPAISFSAARGMLPLPVNGVKIRNFGDPDSLGGAEKGLAIAVRPGAQVTSPCDGLVVYAGPFRSYGQLLILNAGGGYHVLLMGMERISVDPGQFVLTGEPVAAMGSGGQIATAAAAMTPSQPVLYIEFRKDGTPIDPGPWWATSESEKVRG